MFKDLNKTHVLEFTLLQIVVLRRADWHSTEIISAAVGRQAESTPRDDQADRITSWNVFEFKKNIRGASTPELHFGGQ